MSLTVLPVHLRAPVPRGSEPPVNARARVEEVVGAGTVEAQPEEVGQDRLRSQALAGVGVGAKARRRHSQLRRFFL